MVLPPLELFSLKKEAALLPGGFFHLRPNLFDCFLRTVCGDARMTTKVQSRPDLLLLLSLLLVILLNPILDHGDLRRLILTALTFVPVILSTITLSQKKSWILPSILLMLGTLIFGVMCAFIHSRILLGLKWGLLAAFFAVTVAGLFSYLKNARSVLGSHLYAAVSIYLLLGMLWFAIYCAIEVIHPGSFGRSNNTVADRQSELLYFSLITLGTIGYGDVVPIQEEARMLAALEGIAGVLYIAIAVALLINAYRHHPSSQE